MKLAGFVAHFKHYKKHGAWRTYCAIHAGPCVLDGERRCTTSTDLGQAEVRCSHLDSFIRRVGNKHALAAAMRDLRRAYERPIRTAIWAAYFAASPRSKTPWEASCLAQPLTCGKLWSSLAASWLGVVCSRTTGDSCDSPAYPLGCHRAVSRVLSGVVWEAAMNCWLEALVHMGIFLGVLAAFVGVMIFYTWLWDSCYRIPTWVKATLTLTPCLGVMYFLFYAMCKKW